MPFIQRGALLLGVGIFVMAMWEGILLTMEVPAKSWPGPVEKPDGVSLVRRPLSWTLRTLYVDPPPSKRLRKTVAVMVENHEEARPHHSGLEHALLITEFLVEAGISRFSAVFDANDLPEKIGPIRSIRPYFIDMLMPWTDLILHAGGSPEAYELVEQSKEIDGANALTSKFEFFFERDDAIAAPHNLFTTQKDAAALSTNHAINTVAWPPYSTGSMDSQEDADIIKINFLSGLHNVRYTFNAESQQYERKNGYTVSKATPSNVVILQMPITKVAEYGRLTIKTTGSGEALVFRNGGMAQGYWKRGATEETLSLHYASGRNLHLEDGQTWITVLPELNRVSWETED